MQEHIQSLKDRAEAALVQLIRGIEGGDRLADSVIEELRAVLREVPGADELLAPLMDRLQAARKAPLPAGPIRWVAVGGGHLAIGHRPKMKAIPVLRKQGSPTS